MRLIIDRFEGDYAVVETDSGSIDIPRGELPDNAKSGDVLKKTADGFIIAETETRERRNKILKMMKRLTKE